MKAPLFIRNTLVLTVAAMGLAACGGDMDDLDTYINDIKSRRGGRIEPLPEITPYEVFTYIADAESLRSPFTPDTPQSVGPASGPGPDESRLPEFLEQFPLDTLRMVGTLNLADTDYGLVQTADGLIHRVIPGNFMGTNDGRIVTITEAEISLVEIISDGIGGYVERDAALGLSSN